MPSGVQVKDLKWVSIWCRQYSVNFGELVIPDQPPETQRTASMKTLGQLTTRSYEVSGTVKIDEEANTLTLDNFYYNGRGPDAYIYVGTSGNAPSGSGTHIKYPQGSEAKLGVRFFST